MKTKFDKFKLNENNNNTELINKFREFIDKKIEDIIFHIYQQQTLNVDIDMLYDSEDIYDMKQNITDTLIKTMLENLPKYQYDSYEYQKHMIELILNDEIGMSIKDFLEELKENDVKIHTDIKDEYEHILNAENMGLL